MARIKRDLAFAGFDPEVTWNERSAVHVGWVLVAGLPREAGFSASRTEMLSIKIEVDTRPPAGARCEKRLVTRHVTFLLQYFDLPSQLAGKLHAVLTRKYPKGRDWYDLVWYRSRRPPIIPNLSLLGNALAQTQATGRCDPGGWRVLVRDRLADLDMEAVARDVRPFLERPHDAALLTRDNLMGLLEGR